MCIFAYPVVSVSNTKILVAPLSHNRQVTVYENEAHSDNANTMILPVPIGPQGGNTLVLFDVSKTWPGQTLWKECDKFFRQPNLGNGGGSFGFSIQKEIYLQLLECEIN